MSSANIWPELNWQEWSATANTLHRFVQIVGKVRMALTPRINHWWNVTLYVTPRGLTTGTISQGDIAFAMTFDFIDHVLLIETSGGVVDKIKLEPMPVAEFYAMVMGRLRHLGVDVHIWTMPCEIADAIPFDHDRAKGSYDPAPVERFHRVLLSIERVMQEFRAKFVGKVSPVHFFWGSFDLSVTRFSGRTAPPHPGSAPNMANWAMREAYSHEVSSCGFWPGNGGYGKPAFYSYAYPEPPNFLIAKRHTPDAFYDVTLKEFILPYDALRDTLDPDRVLMEFFEDTYVAAADAGRWDRRALERQG